MAEKVKTSNKSEKAPLTPEQRAQAKRARFLRLAPKRVNAALKRIAAVANLGSVASYTYTSEEAIKILEALRNAVKAADTAFNGKREDKPLFTL